MLSAFSASGEQSVESKTKSYILPLTAMFARSLQLTIRATPALALWCTRSSSTATPQPGLPLCFLSAATLQECVGGPYKKPFGCEDAYLASSHVLGVADGVGEWGLKGIDSGRYARTLMAGAAAASEDRRASPLAVLQAAHRSTRVPGSSTALVVLAGQDGTIKSINVGDSSVQLWRRSRLATPTILSLEEAGRLWTCHHSAAITQHVFNTPRQLAASAHNSDRPTEGAVAAWPAAGGELLILGTDGLWDNLGEEEVRAVLARFDFTPCQNYARLQRRRYAELLQEQALASRGLGIAQGGAGLPLETRYPIAPAAPVSPLEVADLAALCKGQLAGMAAALAMRATQQSLDATAMVPWARAAVAAGYTQQRGGKPDDITVVCALVTVDPGAVDVLGLGPE